MKEVAGQAWEVRSKQRKGLLDEIKQRIRNEVNIIGFDLYFMLHHELEWELFQRNETDYSVFLKVYPEVRAQAHLIFTDTFFKVRRLQRSEEEGNSILADLFAWTSSEMVTTYHEALRAQARENPMLVYGVGKSTDLVPIE